MNPIEAELVPAAPFFKNVQCARETEILVEQQPPQGVFVCDHAGLVINQYRCPARFRWHAKGVSTFGRCHLP